MGVSTEIRPATLEDARMIAPLLRDADKQEIKAATGLSPERALEITVRLCDQPLLGLINDEPASIWGINPASIVSGTGSPWMVGTPILERTAKYWLPVAFATLRDMGKEYRILENYVDARNRKSIRWLKWMGFRFDSAKPYGPFGQDFHRFSLEFAGD